MVDPLKTQPADNWQRNLVLTARNTPVWLVQLSQKYQQDISRLDQIPEEEISLLAERGFTGLWLVGLWQRSPASLKIKRLYGREQAIASAYSIYAYRPAENLGGEKGLASLREKVNARGIFLACDMVPNHTGLDSPWIYEHPERYITVQHSPKENFSFNSPNLSDNPAGDIFLEEGYYNQTGAAEVFKFVPQNTGQEMFIYHGNDGTSMPWNDTAQLNYLNPDTRQAFMQEILQVAQHFNIIRLDAAMTLVREHFKRLWFPSPGGEKFIPTRGCVTMSDEEFDQLMPHEFWAEVIQKIQSEAPQTLLIAEAFWLMEKYFINEIGMHRVYNSAFMHQLCDEDNLKFRSYLKDILQSSPNLLERFVNFLTTPDEESAALQFGKSDKYLGACRLLACMPGLPLFGHGQWEGLQEHYGMDIPCPMQAEEPDASLIALHDRHIRPLLRQRSLFSSVENFYLYNFMREDYSVNENVIVFSTIAQGQRSLIVFNNSTVPANGSIYRTVVQLPTSGNHKPGSLPLVQALQLDALQPGSLELRDYTQGDCLSFPLNQTTTPCLRLELGPYESHVFQVCPT